MTGSQDESLVSNEVATFVRVLFNERGIKIANTDVSAGTINGDNYLGIIAKVQVKGKDKNGKSVTLNLIVKSAPRSGLIRDFAPIRNAYAREIYLYSKVLPAFVKLQEERGILHPFKSFANYYGSTMADVNEALVMEDMKAVGYKLQNRMEPLDYDHVIMVLKEYGKLHALSFAMRDQKPEVFKELSQNCEDSYFTAVDIAQMEEGLKQQKVQAIESLDPVKHKVAYDKYKHFQERMLRIVIDAVSSKRAGKFAVIGHGDCWINNMLFKYENPASPNTPTEMCLLDWQLSRLGSPALDLSYFIFSATDKAMRETHYDGFIKEYYNSFCSHLQQLGSDPERLFPFEALQGQLKQFSMYGLYMASIILSVITSPSEDIPDIHSMKDMQEAVEKFEGLVKNQDKYHSRISGVILDFVDLGYDM